MLTCGGALAPLRAARRTTDKQKAATGDWSGGGFSQYETTTDVPMWPRPKTYSQAKKPPLGVEISRGFSTLRTRVTTRKKVAVMVTGRG
jgi:hypothetical protein